jgi:serine phosphatase RsbU (regulator of sigma subunit)
VLVTGESAVACEIPSGPAIGVIADAEWAVHRFELPGEPWSLMFYTDGLVEGRGPDGRRPYGIERLLPALAATGPGITDADLDRLLSIVEATNDAPLPDDVIILAISRPAIGVPSVTTT